MDAARNAGVDIVAASELPNALAASNPSGLLTLDFLDPDRAARQAREFAELYPVDAVIPVDEDTAVAAASAAGALGLKHNPVSAARAAKNKRLMREVLKRAGVRVPRFAHFTLDDDLDAMSRRVTFPCVVKPVFLSTSRGVMRANDRGEFISALKRLEAILKIPSVARKGGAEARDVLAEEFIPGREVALEGLLSDGGLRALAIFDKPDPLDGPFFEETIYVTPSRLPAPAQEQIVETTSAAARAMGLINGAVHAELRVNDEGAWVIEVAARAIGGLCSRALRFGEGLSLEELLIRHAVGEDVSGIERERRASGVMMIPIPRPGVLREVRGLDSARATPDVEEIIISAHVTQELLPPPEGASYLGFIFSRSETPDRVEAALREAHGRLEFVIE